MRHRGWFAGVMTAILLAASGSYGARGPQAPVQGRPGAAELQSSLFAAVRSNDGAMITKLINDGADPDGVDPDGDPCLAPLVAAAERGRVEALELLLVHGAFLDWEEEWDWEGGDGCQAPRGPRALEVAAGLGHVGVTELLTRRGVRSRAALGAAAMAGHLEVAASLLRHDAELYDPNALTHKDGESAMFLAIHSGHPDIVELFLDHGASISSREAYSAGLANPSPRLLELVAKNAAGFPVRGLVSEPWDSRPDLLALLVPKLLWDVSAASTQERVRVLRDAVDGSYENVTLFLVREVVGGGTEAYDGDRILNVLEYAIVHQELKVAQRLLGVPGLPVRWDRLQGSELDLDTWKAFVQVWGFPPLDVVRRIPKTPAERWSVIEWMLAHHPDAEAVDLTHLLLSPRLKSLRKTEALVRTAIDRGYNLNPRQPRDRSSNPARPNTPLEAALSREHEASVVRLLLENGAVLETAGSENVLCKMFDRDREWTFLEFESGAWVMPELEGEKDFRDSIGAWLRNKIEVVELLLEHGADPQRPLCSDTKSAVVRTGLFAVPSALPLAAIETTTIVPASQGSWHRSNNYPDYYRPWRLEPRRQDPTRGGFLLQEAFKVRAVILDRLLASSADVAQRTRDVHEIMGYWFSDRSFDDHELAQVLLSYGADFFTARKGPELEPVWTPYGKVLSSHKGGVDREIRSALGAGAPAALEAWALDEKRRHRGRQAKRLVRAAAVLSAVLLGLGAIRRWRRRRRLSPSRGS